MQIKELDNDVVVVENDSLGNASKFTLDTGIYDFTIKQMYPVKNKSGSYSMQLVLETIDSKKFNPLVYFMDSNGNITQEGKYGESKGKKVPIKGYSTLDSICKIAIGKSLSEASKSSTTKTVIKQFTKDEKISVDMIMDSIGKTITLGIEEVRSNKQVLSNGRYVDSSEERITNEINKVYYPDRLTIKEKSSGKTEPEFANAWLEKYADKVTDKFKPVAGSKIATTTTSTVDLFE